MPRPDLSQVIPVLCVSDLPASLEHYQKVLGFDRPWAWSESAAFEPGAHPTFARVERGEFGLFLCEKGQGQPGAWVCLNLKSVGDLEQVYQEYLASGAKIIESPRNQAWGMREMIVEDPDGNTFRLGAQLE